MRSHPPKGRRPSENSEISKEESELLGYYRQASDNGKFVILSVAKGAEKKAQTALGKVSNG